MPELPEVETTKRGIEPYLLSQQIKQVIVRHPTLRWPIPKQLASELVGHTVTAIKRRAKYLLLSIAEGTLIIHLGMSGRLRILTEPKKADKHDHVDVVLQNGVILRFTDHRRFGAILWTKADPLEHTLLASIGPEPLSKQFTGDYLWQRAQGKKVAVKVFIMDSKIVAGVGNIYAAEALFLAGIYPETAANALNKTQYAKLASAIKTILKNAIKKGGTTLRDFAQSDGKPGYFSQVLNVYGRADEPCRQCKTLLTLIRLGQRSTVYCKKCQR